MSTHAPGVHAALARELDPARLASVLAAALADEVYPDLAVRPAFRGLVDDACRAKAELLVDLLADRVSPDDLAPAAAVALAHELAVAGVPAETVARSYRVGQEVAWATLLDAIERLAERDGVPVVESVRATTPVLFAFVERMMTVTMAAYDDALDDERRSLARRRRRLVDGLLDGTVAAIGEDGERFLGYRLDGLHLAIALPGPATRTDEGLVRRLGTDLGTGGTLVVGERAWIHLARPLRPSDRAAVGRAFAEAGRRGGVGDPGSGVPGFRASHEQAELALRVRRARGHEDVGATWARDVGIEALGLEATTSARRLATAELAALEGLSARTRRTLLAWLETGSNVGAAARLGVHEQTVRNHLRLVEDRLPGPLLERRTELHVALRLAAVLEPRNPRTGGPGFTQDALRGAAGRS
ncbi:helix-turn-helix domain-containing protein [Patulibacter brassicae]|uniref:Helix-turn-helix domain-containing protein n=1 Tax=Patulibacter brassicae TaxID=1705717 RepID=A0ABU4VGS4_9ACTN|nr:helix-turn-helix domain-containing protein [Patulibacter brassicae]MDX8150983.1 helix-turn-helix domain-containing protein [Patulibacter brassicae]